MRRFDVRVKKSLVKKFRVMKTNNFDKFIKNFEQTNNNLFFFCVNVNATRALRFVYFDKNNKNKYRNERCDGATSAYFQIFDKRMTLNSIRSQNLSEDIFFSKLKH